MAFCGLLQCPYNLLIEDSKSYNGKDSCQEEWFSLWLWRCFTKEPITHDDGVDNNVSGDIDRVLPYFGEMYLKSLHTKRNLCMNTFVERISLPDCHIAIGFLSPNIYCLELKELENVVGE